MTILLFRIHWSKNCKVIETMLNNIKNIEVIDIEQEDNRYLLCKYKVMEIPTLIKIDKDGNEIERIEGLAYKNDILRFLGE